MIYLGNIMYLWLIYWYFFYVEKFKDIYIVFSVSKYWFCIYCKYVICYKKILFFCDVGSKVY